MHKEEGGFRVEHCLAVRIPPINLTDSVPIIIHLYLSALVPPRTHQTCLVPLFAESPVVPSKNRTSHACVGEKRRSEHLSWTTSRRTRTGRRSGHSGMGVKSVGLVPELESSDPPNSPIPRPSEDDSPFGPQLVGASTSNVTPATIPSLSVLCAQACV